ncbi:MAG TPA: alpha/beta fold hydrolase [Pyrinomonadaceae bacterium]|jgi:pimeloyl-ACP methyl ester carboxylesterase|nr:alpha/beta fold hydrolase [Pyrinomonadaceae bacterium]
MSVAHVRGIELAYEVAGAGSPLVLLHGFPFNRTLWREQVESLSGHYRVITVDLRGHGETTATRDPAMMEEMAEDVAALLDELGIAAPVVLGGLSMGGYVALAFTRLFPARVRALLLADTRPQTDTAEARLTREETATRALNEGMQAVADAMLSKLFAPSTQAERPDVVARVREMILSTKPQGAASALRGMAVRADHTKFLREISCPVLIIVGSLDQVTPLADSELMAREIRGARLEVIAGAGHVSNVERPAEFNRALENFLRELEA